MIDEITRLMRLLEFSDSAFPVGTFSFSNGKRLHSKGSYTMLKRLNNIPVRLSVRPFTVML